MEIVYLFTAKDVLSWHISIFKLFVFNSSSFWGMVSCVVGWLWLFCCLFYFVSKRMRFFPQWIWCHLFWAKSSYCLTNQAKPIQKIAMWNLFRASSTSLYIFIYWLMKHWLSCDYRPLFDYRQFIESKSVFIRNSIDLLARSALNSNNDIFMYAFDEFQQMLSTQSHE